MTALTEDISFPCPSVPDDPSAARLLGLYPQRQRGLWMQRVKILGGVLAPAQWRALAEIARDLTPATPLHLTTRQDVELHELTASAVPDVQRRLAQAGLSGLGACGDTLRNVTVCPCSGLREGGVDLAPAAWRIRRVLEAESGISRLPRKFKIALSCHEDCGQPWINDLGLTAALRAGRWGFAVTAGGSLGACPAPGIRLAEWLDPGDVLPLAAAAVRVFAAQGDRTNRRRARLRHVRQRLGDTAFATLVHDALRQAKAQRHWPAVELPPAAAMAHRAMLTFPNGDVTSDQADALAALAGNEGLRVRIANSHRVAVFARDAGALDAALNTLDALAGPRRPQPAVVVCPGTRWCARALADTRGMADAVRALGDLLPASWTVCISGCPNGCAHTAVADVGLSGVRTTRPTGPRGADAPPADERRDPQETQDAGRQEAFDLYAGGGMGRDGRLAGLVARKLAPADAVARIARLVGGDPKDRE